MKMSIRNGKFVSLQFHLNLFHLLPFSTSKFSFRILNNNGIGKNNLTYFPHSFFFVNFDQFYDLTETQF